MDCLGTNIGVISTIDCHSSRIVCYFQTSVNTVMYPHTLKFSGGWNNPYISKTCKKYILQTYRSKIKIYTIITMRIFASDKYTVFYRGCISGAAKSYWFGNMSGIHSMLNYATVYINRSSVRQRTQCSGSWFYTPLASTRTICRNNFPYC